MKNKSLKCWAVISFKTKQVSFLQFYIYILCMCMCMFEHIAIHATKISSNNEIMSD